MQGDTDSTPGSQGHTAGRKSIQNGPAATKIDLPQPNFGPRWSKRLRSTYSSGSVLSAIGADRGTPLRTMCTALAVGTRVSS